MHPERKKHIGIVVILGLLSMLMPFAIDMYLPALPIIAAEYGVSAGSVQMTLSAYVLGFAIGQLFYGPMADCLGRKPVIMFGTFCFALAAAACALSQSVEMLIYMRLLHSLAAAAASVVINALMRDMFTKDDFSRMMPCVVLVMTVAPLLAPIIGGGLLVLLSWHAIFWTIGLGRLWWRQYWCWCLFAKRCRANGGRSFASAPPSVISARCFATSGCSVTC